jgi:hypothetical protein
MKNTKSTAIVPTSIKLPVVAKNNSKSKLGVLSDGERHFEDRVDVQKNLPDILGRALARTWIDGDFRLAFENDPIATLMAHGIHLPETMSIEFQTKNADRPRIVVYEQRAGSKFKARVLYLQLVMMAGR